MSAANEAAAASAPGVDEWVDAFKQKQIAGTWVPEPYATRLVQAGGKVLVDERDLWPGKKFAITVLAVRTDTSVQPASRWYTGQGIYRHVRLVLTDQVRVVQGGLYITTPELSATAATARTGRRPAAGGR